MSAIAKKMLQRLKQRFEYATDTSAAKFDPLFVTAIFLNPSYRDILTDTQTKTAKQYLLELCKPPESDSNLQDDDCTYVPDTDLQENHEITPPSKHPKLLAIKGSFISRRKEKQSNNSTSLSSEDKEVDRYSKNSFNLELELKMTPLTFGIPLKIIQSLHLLPVTFYVYHLQQPRLKGFFQQVGNQHLENTTD